MDSTCEYYYECLCHKALSTCAKLLATFGGRTINCNDYDCATCNCYKEISIDEDTNNRKGEQTYENVYYGEWNQEPQERES